MKTRIDAILFDMDGTLFDSEIIAEQGWILAAQEFGQTFTHQDYLKFVGIVTDVCHQQAHRKWGESFPMARFIKRKSEIYRELKTQGVLVKAGAQAFLNKSRQLTPKLGLVTSSTRSAVKENFQYLAGLEQFQTIVTAENTQRKKPEPDCYLLACQQLEVKPEHTLVIEDSNPGCLAAIRAGCKTLCVPDMVPITSEIEKQLFARYDSLNQALSLLDSLDFSQNA
ncbi:HAD family phosphatase [Saccharobesus litoralis]|uniref:HAD family phosphatase n=1 Tax=Saccharobesus litoralis TaxID=2172099 RepID=A0A2S0VW68_9ALTE|nr:HAD family phosphatase [Saccharobesus litoralis]AWB68423.1 HAD family phosphatase [Saccharobesus litoralis]